MIAIFHSDTSPHFQEVPLTNFNSHRFTTYKPPMAQDIPTDLRITLLPKGDNKHGVLRSKATGEPALCLTYCVVTALRQAITSARADAGLTDWFEITTPLTVEKAHLLCKTNATDYRLKTKTETLPTASKLEDNEFIFVPNEQQLIKEDLKESSCSLN
ncbi:Xanthine dehydrogenase [Armadillidium vulgare]|nr:Xanthine dehydrogenase [Armadillidium vulgare]